MYSRFADIRTTGSHSTIMQRVSPARAALSCLLIMCYQIIFALIPGGLLAAILTVILIIVEVRVSVPLSDVCSPPCILRPRSAMSAAL
jgi:hypothetical protein